MGQVGQVLARFQHGRIHQWREIGVVVHLQLRLSGVHGFGLSSSVISTRDDGSSLRLPSEQSSRNGVLM